jgi:molecular chaperone GrpE
MSEQETKAEQEPQPDSDATAIEAASESSQSPGTSLEEKLRAELDEVNDKYLRMLAETENFKKRMARERVEERQYAAQETVLAFLPVADNLDRALQAALKNQSTGSSDPGHLSKGVELTLRQFEDILRKLSVEVIPCEVGKPFDPEMHQALFQEQHAEYEDGSILELLQKGYRIGDRVIRPAMVKVSRKP